MFGFGFGLWLASGSGGPPSGTHFLSWDNDTATIRIQWDDENGNPKFLAWDI